MRHSQTSQALCGLFAAVILMGCITATPARAQGKVVQTPYHNPKALIDIYLDDPQKLGSALYWLRGLVNPLTEAPYSMFPEDMSIVVLMHGTEIVTLARKTRNATKKWCNVCAITPAWA